MKLSRYFIVVIAVVAMMTSCNKQELGIIESVPEYGQEHKMRISSQKSDATSPADTRTFIDGIEFTWAGKDKLKLHTTKNDAEFLLAYGAKTKQATFQGALRSVEEFVYAAYPYSDAVFEADKCTFLVDPTQWQHHTWDAEIDPISIGNHACMYGKSTENVTTEISRTTDVDIPMKHLTAIFDFNITNIPRQTTINSFELKASSKVFKTRLDITLSTGESTGYAEQDNVMVYLANSRYDTNQNIGDTTAHTIRLAILPTTIHAGEELTMTLTTINELKEEVSRVITIPLVSEKKYEAGKVYSMPLDYSLFDEVSKSKRIRVSNGQKTGTSTGTTASVSKAVISGELTLRDDDLTLTITGEMTEADFTYLHYSFTSKNGILDLSGATLPNNKVPALAFNKKQTGNTTLTKIILPATATEVGSHAFLYCRKFASIKMPGVITLETGAFFGCPALATITMPNVTTIEGSTFVGCDSLTVIDIPRLALISSNPFRNCEKLRSITFGGSNTNDHFTFERKVLYNKNKSTIYTYLNSNTAAIYTAPNGVKKVDKLAFFSNDSLVEVHLPNVVVIEQSAFAYNDALEVVTMPLVETINSRVFTYNKKITDIVMKNVTTIGKDVFSSCENLANITLGATAPTVGEDAFDSVTDLTIWIPAGSEDNYPTTIWKDGFRGATKLTISTY